MDLASRTVARAFLRTVFAYSTMMSIYLMLNSITHPKTMTQPLTHVLDWPTEGSVLAVAVTCSVLSYFLLRVSTHLSRSSKRGDS